MLFCVTGTKITYRRMHNLSFRQIHWELAERQLFQSVMRNECLNPIWQSHVRNTIKSHSSTEYARDSLPVARTTREIGCSTTTHSLSVNLFHIPSKGQLYGPILEQLITSSKDLSCLHHLSYLAHGIPWYISLVFGHCAVYRMSLSHHLVKETPVMRMSYYHHYYFRLHCWCWADFVRRKHKAQNSTQFIP